jgi:hypothetical protein
MIVENRQVPRVDCFATPKTWAYPAGWPKS